MLLAGVTIGTLSGDNGIINRAINARDLTDKEGFADAVQTQALLTVAETGRFDTERFEERIKEHLKEYNPNVTEDDDSVTVSDGVYDVTLDKESGDVTGSGHTDGVWPRVQTHLYEMDGSEYKPIEDSEQLTLTVDVTNFDVFDDVEVVVTDEDGNEIPQTDLLPDTEGQFSFTVEGPSGTYTVDVTGYVTGEDGERVAKTSRRTVKLKENPRIKLNITIAPNGGPEYVMPTKGKATIQATMTSSEGNRDPYEYYYAWSQNKDVKPGFQEWNLDSWTGTKSGDLIKKTDCEVGTYYLWIQVYDKNRVLTSQYVVSDGFEVHSSKEKDYSITFTEDYPNTVPINKDVKVTPTYGKYLINDKQILVTGKEGNDYTITGTEYAIVKTNNQTVTVTARDLVGNTVTEEYTVKNIDKVKPVIDFKPDGDNNYAQSHSTEVTVTDDGVSGMVKDSIKYVWIQGNGTPENYATALGGTDTKREDETLAKVVGTVTRAEGTGPDWHLWVIVQDRAGNVTTKQSQVFYFDNTMPNKEAPTLLSSTNTVKATFHQTDANSGINETTREYGIKKKTDPDTAWIWEPEGKDENGFHVFTDKILETEYEVKTRVIDKAGNGKQESTVATSTTSSIKKPEIDYSPKEWTNTDVTVTITYPPSANSTLIHEYSVGDQSHWTAWPESDGYIKVPQNTTVYAQQHDSTNQGNTRIESLKITVIDKENPTITYLDTNNHGPVNVNLTLTGRAEDKETNGLKNDSGIVAFQFSKNADLKWNSNGWTSCLSENKGVKTLEKTYTIQENGTYYFYVKDDAENVSKKDFVVNNIDKVAPVIGSVEVDATWRNYDKTIKVNATDAGTSKIAAYAITTSNDRTKIPAGEWVNSSSNTWTSQKTYNVGTYYAWVKDNAGNISNPYTVYVKNIEKIKPTISVNTDTNPKKKQVATVTISDTGDSGLAQGDYVIQYEWNTATGNPSSYTKQTTIKVTSNGLPNATTTIEKADGTNTFYLHVKGINIKDVAQNTDSPTAEGKFVIDNTGPTVIFNPDGNTNPAQSHSVTVTCKDDVGAAGVKTSSLKWLWKASATAPAASEFTATFTSGNSTSKNGVTSKDWYLWVYAEDNIGNQTIIKTKNPFWLDNTKPTISEAVQDPTVWKKDNKRIKINAADSGVVTSGIAGYMIKDNNTTPKAGDQGWVTPTGNAPWYTGFSYSQRKWYVWVKDGVGNVSDVREVNVDKIEAVNPVITIDDPGTAPKYTQNAIVGIQDTGSRIKSRNIYNTIPMGRCSSD